jgi:hypothetical protein
MLEVSILTQMLADINSFFKLKAGQCSFCQMFDRLVNFVKLFTLNSITTHPHGPEAIVYGDKRLLADILVAYHMV